MLSKFVRRFILKPIIPIIKIEGIINDKTYFIIIINNLNIDNKLKILLIY